MKNFTMMLIFAAWLGLAGCNDDRDFNPAGTAQNEDVGEGGPESDRTETRSEAAVPEWEEQESGEVGDGDQ